MTKLNKQEVITAISGKVNGLTKKTTEEVLNAFIEVVKETVAKGDGISLVGFMGIEVKDRVERNGRNPQTGESIVIPAGKRVVVKVGKGLKDAIK